MQNSDIRTRITSLHRSQTSSVVFAFKTATLGPELQVPMGSRHHLWLCAFKTATLAPELLVSMVPWLHLSFLCLQNNVISVWITSLYGSQPSSVVFACKTSTFGSELQVSIGPRIRLLTCEYKTASLDPEWRLSIGPSLHLWFCAFTTATLASEILVWMCPSPHLWLLHAKQRL